MPANPVGGGRLGECGLIVPAGAPPLPSDISAGAWLIADLDTGEVLAAKDPHGRYRPASTLKLLTVQPLLKNLKNLDLIVDGTENDAGQDGTRVGIEAGGKYTVQQLLTYLIIISGNDAANALARTNGGYDKTIADMNATAQALGALDTRAATVSGLDGPGQSTSAYDLALFAKADMATPLFPEIVSSVDVRVPAAEGEGYIAANDNQLLYQYPGALGGKTGFTDDAGNTYVGNGRAGRPAPGRHDDARHPAAAAAMDAGRVAARLGLRAAGEHTAGRHPGQVAGRGHRRRRGADPEHHRPDQCGIDRVGQRHQFRFRRIDLGRCPRNDVIVDLERDADCADPGRYRPADRHCGNRPAAAAPPPEQAPRVCR